MFQIAKALTEGESEMITVSEKDSGVPKVRAFLSTDGG